MKATKITCLALGTLLLASSCESSYQAAGGVTGAMIGSHVGSAVGYLSGGHRHGRYYRGGNAALGSLIGMGIGAALGVGIASQIEQKEKAEARRRDSYGDGYGDYDTRENRRTTGGYESNRDYQIGGGAYQGNSGGTYQGNSSAVISISDLTFMDIDGTGYISKGETIEVEGYITNTSNSVLNDVIIFLKVDDEKRFRLSPSLTTTLRPGQKIRYTGRILCDRAKRGQAIGICLNTLYAGKQNTSSTLFVEIR
jgi:hypothetical protein